MVRKSKKEICELIGVKPSGLKTIERRGKLNERLLSIGYNLINKRMEGEAGKQQTWYYLEEIMESIDIDDFNALVDSLISIDTSTKEVKQAKIVKKEEFGLYLQGRVLDENKPVTNQELADITGVNTKTIIRWNKVARDSGLIQTNGHFFFRIDENGYFDEVDRKTFIMTWAKVFADDGIKKAEEQYNNGEISLKEFGSRCRYYGRLEGIVSGICIRQQKYKVCNQDLVDEFIESMKKAGIELSEEQKEILGSTFGNRLKASNERRIKEQGELDEIRSNIGIDLGVI